MLYNSLSFIVPYLVIIRKFLPNSLPLGLVLCSPTLFKSSLHHRYISYAPSYTQKRFYSSNTNTISPDNIEERIFIEQEQEQIQEIELEQVQEQLLELPIDLEMSYNANVSTDSTDSTDDNLEMEKNFYLGAAPSNCLTLGAERYTDIQLSFEINISRTQRKKDCKYIVNFKISKCIFNSIFQGGSTAAKQIKELESLIVLQNPSSAYDLLGVHNSELNNSLTRLTSELKIVEIISKSYIFITKDKVIPHIPEISKLKNWRSILELEDISNSPDLGRTQSENIIGNQRSTYRVGDRVLSDKFRNFKIKGYGKTHRREFHSSIPVRSSNEEALNILREKLAKKIKEVHELQNKSQYTFEDDVNMRARLKEFYELQRQREQ